MVTGRRILLLADDSPATQKVVSLTFADEGLEVVAVGDGTEAARRLEEGLTPDVVLADVIMPGLTGYELCERIKGDGRLARVPVVLLVGTFEPFNEAEARRVGADTVLTKPFQSIRDLVSKVGSLIGGAKPEAEDETTRPAAPPREATQMEAAPPHEASRQEPPSQQDEASSFADLGLDDQMIEARPAENYAETQAAPHAPSAAHAEAEGARAEAEAAQAPVAAERAHDSFAETLRDPFAAVTPRAADEWRGEAERRDEAQVFAETQTSFARVPVAEEARAPQPAFAARVAGAAAADDALLDLDLDAPPSVSEADDFILDLGDEDERPVSHSAAPVEAAAPPPDTAGAFAEAAHGETVQDSRAAVQQLQELQAGHAHMATEVVARDEPHAPAVGHGLSDEREFADVQDFGSHTAREVMSAAVVEEAGASSHGAAVAPRGFVEPEVVPAAEASHAVVEAEFTDGSVEGDVAKPPAGGFVETPFEAGAAPVVEAEAAPVIEEAAPVLESAASTRAAESSSAAHESPFPPAPSTAGYEMGAARVGVEEGVRPEQLSPEVLDAIARRVVELMSDKVVREIAWEVVPDLAELLIKQKIDEDSRRQ